MPKKYSFIVGIKDLKTVFTGDAQKKSEVGQDAQILDESLDNFKKPKSDLDISQKIASTGETVPIVFGKRVNNIGGIWIQPSLVKAGTSSFVQKLLFVISQGEVISTPNKSTSFTGLRKLSFLDDTSISLNHIFSTAAALTTTPNLCPISNTGLFCGNDIYTYLSDVLPASSGNALQIRSDLGKDFSGTRVLTIGVGDTSNTTFRMSLQVFDAETGSNITNAYATYTQSTTPIIFDFNTVIVNGVTQGKTVGTVENFLDTNDTLFAPINSTTVAAGIYTQSELNALNAVSNGRTKFIFKYTFVSVNTQTNTNNPASTGTLTGVQAENIIGTSSVIQNTSNNNSSFADITFLATSGNLFETPSSGTFPTTTKQLYLFYEQGVKVDLFSAGLSGSNYTQGASNQFIDLAMHLFKLYKKIDGNNTSSIVSPVKTTNLQNLSTFCTNNNMFYNGIISKAVNIVDYIQKTSPFYFLSFLSVGGQYQFASILPINNSNQIDTTALTPVLTFTESNIIQNTFRKVYLGIEERRAFIANCIYTECIPTEVSRRKTVSVKFTTTEIDAPTEQFDMSDFCADVNHAILYAKYELSRRKHTTHNISFSTSLITTSLIPTDIIKLQLQRKNSVGDDRTEINYYQVLSITYDNDGISNIEAAHFPLNNSNVAEISNEITSGSFTILQ